VVETSAQVAELEMDDADAVRHECRLGGHPAVDDPGGGIRSPDLRGRVFTVELDSEVEEPWRRSSTYTC